MKKLLLFFLIVNLTELNAQDHFEKLRVEYHYASTDENLANSALVLVKAYMNTNLDSSNYYGKFALKHAFDAEIDSLIAVSYHNLGNVAIYQGNLDIALENYLTVIKLFGENKFPLIIQGVTNNIGIIFDRKKEYPKAREYYLKSEQYLDKLHGVIEEKVILERQSKLYSNIGTTYESEGNSNKAMEFYIKSQGLAKRINDAVQQAIVYSNIGNLHLHEGKLELSEPNYLEALHIYDSLNNKVGISRINMHLGDLYTEMGENEKAIQAFRLSIFLGEETRNGEIVFWASKGLYILLEEKGDFEGAFYELERHKIMNDSLFNAEKAAALERLELEHDFEEEKMKLEEQQRIKTIWNYSLIGGLILLAVIFFLAIRNLRNKTRLASLSNENLELSNKHLSLEKESLEEKLDFKNKELTTNVMYLMKKNEFINTVSDRLLGMRGLFKSDNQKSINRIVIDLQKASEDDVWHEFETHFNRVHADFYDNLSNACPNLSLNERKLCAFVKLNLTTKEICAITHQTTNTLQVARTRLRKKLELESNDQLFSYLQNF